jgi:hypothetical protein
MAAATLAYVRIDEEWQVTAKGEILDSRILQKVGNLCTC